MIDDPSRLATLRAQLRLLPHPEGGAYREHFRAPLDASGRAASTAIFYLLERADISAWHRVEHDELWHHYEGAPVELHLIDDTGYRVVCVGPVGEEKALPCQVVPARTWQAARPLSGWALVGNTVAPAFTFADWTLADATIRAQLAARFPEARQALDDFGQ